MASRRDRFRTKLCRNFALGHCPQGASCNYIHASPESIQTDNSIHSSLGRSACVSLNGQAQLSSAVSPVWSTLSPVTNSSVDQVNYQWGSPAPSGAAPPSRIKYRPLSWRTALCRHFVRNKGWCPLGEECNYIHDIALAEFARDDVRFDKGRHPGNGGRRGKAGSKHSHCWAYVQGLCHVHDCQYQHPVAVHLFAAHTPCLAWPNCRRGPLCPYKHPEPYVSESTPASPALSTQEAKPQVSVPAPDPVPRGAVPYNGMMYFNMQSPQQQKQQQHSLPLPPPPPPPPPALTLPPIQQQLLAANLFEAWRFPYPPTPMTYMPVMVSPPAWPDIGLRWPDNMVPFSHQGLPRPHVPSFSSPNPLQPPTQTLPALNSVTPDHSHDISHSIPDSELPYVPPKQQKNGHARRVSVTIKGREDLDALGLDSTSRVRQPWQSHGDRIGRRSWAPSSSSLHAVGGGALTPPAILYGM
ncbi:hypothetical protein C8Q79DRAFT_998697 [Trametes meyenii]|nr:hypothetical protein C8Q79DRAFT_998697 [Trametes meyenii]